MLSQKIESFLQDEDGGYAIWGLMWFILFVGIGGLAVDITDAYRNQSMLQATADAAALAGIASSLGDENEVDTQATNYAAMNMSTGVHGTVLTTTDVDIGTWNFTTRTFTVGGSNPNAVRAITRRDVNNGNPLATNFLRIAGYQSFDVSTEAIAAKGVDECHFNGIIAGGEFFSRPMIHYRNNICLIGHEQFWFINQGTTFDDGVYVGAGCDQEDKKCIGPGTNPENNDGFDLAFNLPEGNYQDQTMPVNAAHVEHYVETVRNLHTHSGFQDFLSDPDLLSYIDYSGYEDLFHPDGAAPDLYTDSDSVLPATTTPHTIYDLTNCSKSGYVIPEGVYDNVAIIANCPISFVSHGDYTFRNSVIASTFEPKGGKPGDPEDPYDPAGSGKISIHGTADVDLGSDEEGCADGNEMYSYGHVDFASSGNFANLRILAKGHVQFAATSNSEVGTNIEALGDVDIRSGSAAGSTYGLCPNGGTNGPVVLTFALVH
jgi:hypothetical protein